MMSSCGCQNGSSTSALPEWPEEEPFRPTLEQPADHPELGPYVQLEPGFWVPIGLHTLIRLGGIRREELGLELEDEPDWPLLLAIPGLVRRDGGGLTMDQLCYKLNQINALDPGNEAGEYLRFTPEVLIEWLFVDLIDATIFPQPRACYDPSPNDLEGESLLEALPTKYGGRLARGTIDPAQVQQAIENTKRPIHLQYGAYCPLVVAYGLGVDSTAILVQMVQRHIYPSLILFADTGGEWPETYRYLSVISSYLEQHRFPPITVVRYRPRHGHYTTLEQNCLVLETLPSLAFGRKGCSQKWKVMPQNQAVRRWPLAIDAWKQGLPVVKVIGYDAGPADARRSRIQDDGFYHYWYPLREWGWDRDRCKLEIARAGLPVPPKSACFFCPATRPAELLERVRPHPELAQRIAAIEEAAAPRLSTVEGLWRTSTATRPGRMSDFLHKHGLLPQEDRRQSATKHLLFQDNHPSGGTRTQVRRLAHILARGIL